IVRLDAGAARRAAGVAAVVTSADIKHLGQPAVNAFFPDMKIAPYPLLADGAVRFAGEPIAAVVAESIALARDAAEQIEIEYQPLPAVVDGETAQSANAPIVHESLGTNRAIAGAWRAGDAAAAFASAARVVSVSVDQARVAAVSLGSQIVVNGAGPVRNHGRTMPGAYVVPAVDIQATAAYTTTMSTGPYRGAGRPEGIFVIERLMDEAAHALGLDPAEIRRRNFVPAGAFPYRTATGQVYDSGDYGAAFERALTLFEYDRCRAEGLRLAAKPLEAAPPDVVPVIGGWEVRGVPGRRATWAMVADLAYRGTGLPPGESPGLDATVFFNADSEVWSFGTCVATVAIDRDTGRVTLTRCVWVDDAGTIINPLLAEAQLHGSYAQGAGQALIEGIVYDADGQLLTASLMDYAAPRADDFPEPVIGEMHTPSPNNPLGAKGVGEAGCIALPPAI